MSWSTALVCIFGIICVTCVASDWIQLRCVAHLGTAPDSRKPAPAPAPDPRGEGPSLGAAGPETA